MAYLYFDESIRDKGDFIVGALVVCKENLSNIVHAQWRDMGFDPNKFEYKSSNLKLDDPNGQQQRSFLRNVLHSCRLALTICHCKERKELGNHCASLIYQLQNTEMLGADEHQLFLDQNIFISQKYRDALIAAGVAVNLRQDSRTVAGLQVADHAAHALGGMLLEEMGLVKKMVFAGESSGYDPELKIDLGFELWASLRYALIGKNEHIPGLSPPLDDPANPYFRVEGYGLYISHTCSEILRKHAVSRFGTNYLGCIH